VSQTTPRVALVTGSATGIGRACAIQFAERGLDVAVNYSRSEAEAEATAAEVRKRGRRALLCRCDVSDDAAARAMVGRCAEELGGLDVLVNNAGFTRFIKHADLEALSEASWDRTLAVNLKGAFFCSRAAIRLMQARGGGVIVNVASAAGVRGSGSSIAYAASKGGMITMTKSLAAAFAPAVRVNVVCPGPVDTRWMAASPESMAAAVAITPLKRASTAEDIAAVVVFLALDAAMMTGQCLVVDGGRTM
jgi:3-oxoacyl-[acyl-carrier protein] reductase